MRHFTAWIVVFLYESLLYIHTDKNQSKSWELICFSSLGCDIEISKKSKHSIIIMNEFKKEIEKCTRKSNKWFSSFFHSKFFSVLFPVKFMALYSIATVSFSSLGCDIQIYIVSFRMFHVILRITKKTTIWAVKCLTMCLLWKCRELYSQRILMQPIRLLVCFNIDFFHAEPFNATL